MFLCMVLTKILSNSSKIVMLILIKRNCSKLITALGSLEDDVVSSQKEETTSEQNQTGKSMKRCVLDLDLDAARFCVYGKGPMDVSRSALRSSLFSPTSDDMFSWQPWAQCSDDELPLPTTRRSLYWSAFDELLIEKGSWWRERYFQICFPGTYVLGSARSAQEDKGVEEIIVISSLYA